ncbi:MAG: DUF1553 domain-containing protein [Planctomycetes bacterium]|nr:DUF1553 domain-containing protein [Planctomycetota bacterium]
MPWPRTNPAACRPRLGAMLCAAFVATVGHGHRGSACPLPDEPTLPKDADHAMVDASVPADPDAATIWKAKAALIEQDHWSYQPMARPRPPKPAGAASSTADIDRFLLNTMQAQGVVPQGRADRRTLLRRATLDLTGLPPTYDEIRAFEEDTRPDAWSRVIDRLLASPAYGERWARHWLDVARYADSNGLDENTAFANAFRWRDWTVRAFNENLPIDRFIMMQLAGDLMPEARSSPAAADCITATGFLVLGPKVLAEPDKEKLVFDMVDEQVDVVGRAFMGQTLGCARCHDHKFDPISQDQYFALAGVLHSTRTMASVATVARALEREAAANDAVAARAEHAAATERTNKALKGATQRADARVQASWVTRAAPILLAASELPAAAPTLEAEDGAALQGLVVDRDHWGVGIGVVRTGAPGVGRVAWRLRAEVDGPHELRVRAASDEARPVQVELDGMPAAQDALGADTGSFHPQGQQWQVAARLELTAGDHEIALVRDGPFPHIDRVELVPVGRADRRIEASVARASELAVPAALLVQVRNALDREPWLAEWRGELHGPMRDRSELATDLAIRAQAASVAWNALFADGPSVDPRERLDDPSLEADRAALFGPGGPFAVVALLESERHADDRALIARLVTERDRLAGAMPNPPVMVLAVTEQEKPGDLAVHVRGDHTVAPGPKVARGAPQPLSRGTDLPRIPERSSGRLELAQWLVDDEHPLTARVFVNRVWHWHFGRGIVETPSDFGTRGGKPSHPDLLDWLARDFIRHGWDLKRLHRQIMNSDAYTRSSSPDAIASAIDPENRLLWRWTPRRLEAEAIRDSVLAVSGSLDRTMGGSLLASGNFEYVTNDQSANGAQYGAPRRSLYLPVIRNALFGFFGIFDYTDASVTVDARAQTVIAPQALFMLNSPFVHEESRAWAKRLRERVLAAAACVPPQQAEHQGHAMVQEAYRMALGREPTASEANAALAFVASQAALGEDAAWGLYAQVILASSEFITIE